MKTAISFLKFGVLVLALGVSFISCEKENIDNTIEEEIVVDPEKVPALFFRMNTNGQETIKIFQEKEENEACLFGRYSPGVPELGILSSYTIGVGNQVQVFWYSEQSGPHTFVSETDDTLGLLMIDPCINTPGELVELRNYTVILEEIGEIGGDMIGIFEGEVRFGGVGNFSIVNGSFSVVRIEE